MLLRLRSFSHTDGGWGAMLPFIALRHQEMLLRWRGCYVQVVVTFKMLLHSKCCLVEGGVTLNMLLRSCCCYVQDVVTLKMLLRSKCCYVEDVVALKTLLGWRCYIQFAVTLKMLLRSSCSWVEEKTDSCAFRPWFSGGLWHVYVYHKKPGNPKNTQFLWEKKTIYKLMNLEKTKQRWNSGQHIPDMLSACWTNCWYSQVIGRTQNTVKHSENEIFQTGQQWTSIALRGTPSLYPLYPVYIYITYIYVCDHMLYVERDLEPQINRNKCFFPTQPCAM